MIVVNTSRFGKVLVNEHDVITMVNGVIGFPELKKFALLDHDRDSPFKWFQSLDDGAIAFVIIDPLIFKPDYSAEVSPSDVAPIGPTCEEDAVISVILCMPTNPNNMTANLKGPLVFNLQTRKGVQVVLTNPEYTTRHNVMDELRRRSQAA